MCLDINDNKVKILDDKKKVIDALELQGASKIAFTSEPNIIWVYASFNSKYLYNIDTGKKSKEYNYIYKEEFICEQLEEYKMILTLLDRKTLEPISRIDNLTSWEIKNNTLLVTQQVDGTSIDKAYTLNFRELVHEF